MARVRFLESVYLISYKQVFNYNDELDIEDEKLVKHLVDNGHVDILNEEENKELKKSTKKRRVKKDES